MDFTDVGLWKPRRTGEQEILKELLGAAPRYQAVVDGVQYVLPETTDPHWEDFGDHTGWTLLPASEHPRWKGKGPPPRYQPERPREPGWVMPRRRTWPRPKGRGQQPARDPLVHWKTLGDLRRALRTARSEPQALRALRPSADLGTLYDDLNAARDLVDKLTLLLPDALAGLEHAGAVKQLAALRRASVGLLKAADTYALAVDGFAGWLDGESARARQRFLRSLLTLAEVPLYTKSGGDTPGARLFVHAADHIVRAPIAHAIEFVEGADRREIAARHPVIEGLGRLDPRVLALVEALEPEHRFVHDLLAGPRAEKDALKYWRTAIVNYQKGAETALEPERLPTFDANAPPEEPRVRRPDYLPKRPQPSPRRL